jgi:hypothetical protein
MGVEAFLQFALHFYNLERTAVTTVAERLKEASKASERIVESLWNSIGALVPTFTLQECAHFFKAAGCDSVCKFK